MTRNLMLFIMMLIAMPALAAAQSGGEGPDVVVLRPVGNTMAFETTTIEAAAGVQITIVMENTATDAAMHHNVAILDAAPDDDPLIREVGLAAMEAGDAAGFIPDHPAIIAYTPMAAPGERTEVTFTAPAPGKYAFVCLFPGHFMTMRGTLVVTP